LKDLNGCFNNINVITKNLKRKISLGSFKKLYVWSSVAKNILSIKIDMYKSATENTF